jgi:hypothetical protein
MQSAFCTVGVLSVGTSTIVIVVRPLLLRELRHLDLAVGTSRLRTRNRFEAEELRVTVPRTAAGRVP